MTKVYAEKDGDKYMIAAEGHATGSQDVCSAVSAILDALLGLAQNSTERELRVTYKDIQPARFVLDFTGGPRAKAGFDMAVIGLKCVERGHEDYLQVEIREI